MSENDIDILNAEKDMVGKGLIFSISTGHPFSLTNMLRVVADFGSLSHYKLGVQHLPASASTPVDRWLKIASHCVQFGTNLGAKFPFTYALSPKPAVIPLSTVFKDCCGLLGRQSEGDHQSAKILNELPNLVLTINSNDSFPLDLEAEKACEQYVNLTQILHDALHCSTIQCGCWFSALNPLISWKVCTY